MVVEDHTRVLAEMISQYVAERDLYLFSGPIDDKSSDKLIDLVCSGSRANANVSLFLTTHGGDPHAAYRMVRCLQRSYTDIKLLIAGRCKSAGTLVAIGANSLAFGEWGELGPLDMQVSKPDELLFNHSGLDVLQALGIVTESGWDSFATYVAELVGAGLSTRIASQIAGSLAGGLMEPIAAQVDPMRLAEATRAIKVAIAYGERIARGNLKARSLQTLVNDYPAHPFVVDKVEALDLFHNVTDLNEAERFIAHEIEDKRGVLRYPGQAPLILNLSNEYPTDQGGECHDSSEAATETTRERRAGDSPQPEESRAKNNIPATAAIQDGHASE
jgi:hypothetical protein